MVGQVDRLYDSVNRGDLLSANSDRDREGIKSVLYKIKIELLRMADQSSDARDFRRLKILLKELDNYQLLKEDRARIDQLTAQVYQTVEKVARSKGINLGDVEWNLYSTRFSTGLGEFGRSSSGAQWEPSWGLDESYIKVSGQDVQAWLISPTFDLRGIRSPSFYLDHTVLINRNTGRFATDVFDRMRILREAFRARVSTNFKEESPDAATWTDVSLAPFPNSDDFFTVASPSIDLTPFKDKPVTIAFMLDMNATNLGHHYITWQIYGFNLQGAGLLPAVERRSSTLLDHQFVQLDPYQQFNKGDSSGVWNMVTAGGKNYAKIGSNGKPLHTWLLSPLYKIKDQKNLNLVIEETVKNPEWQNFRIKISSNYSGGDPDLATWEELLHQPATEATPDTWIDLVTKPFSMSKYANQKVVIGFEFINESVAKPVIWEIKGLQMTGQGDAIESEKYPVEGPKSVGLKK